MIERLFRDDEGSTSLGMALALLLSLSLVFSAAQVYRVNAASARIQDVADAVALAAENEVAEFMVVAQVCDAISLSLSLAGYLSTGIGVVTLCTPVTAELAPALFEAAETCINARNSFAKSAVKGLNAAQKALPFIAAARGALVALSYGSISQETAPVALAVLCPLDGEEITLPDFDDEEFFEAVDEEKDDLQEEAQEAEEAASEANDLKEEAFWADCGNAPARCMYERAESLATLSGSENPFYHSADTWSFEVPLQRARAYYAARLAQEAPASSDFEEVSRSALRAQFYRYMCSALEKAYVWDTDEGFSAYFPRAPRNTEEMRETTLYTDALFPVTSSGSSLCMHSCAACPEASGAIRLGSIQEMEAGGFVTCPTCGFTASSMGSVASATCSVVTGFEYHYNAVADAATMYQVARAKSDPLVQEAQEDAQSLFDQCLEVCKKLTACRIKVQPPGRDGAFAVAVDCSSVTPGWGVGDALSASSSTLGTRAALSAATLLADESSSNKTVVNSLLDSLANSEQLGITASQLVLDCWSGLLQAYGDGQEAIESTLEEALNSLPLVGACGLGTWAADVFSSTMEALGLEPANLDALKPVLVNTMEVAFNSESEAALEFATLHEALEAGTLGVQGLIQWADDAAGAAETGASLSEDLAEVAIFEGFGVEGAGSTLAIVLPDGAQSALDAALSSFAQAVSSAAQQIGGFATWS